MGRRNEVKYRLRGGMTRSDVIAAVNERDGYKCTDCGKTEAQHIKETGRSLQCHRITPGSIYTVAGCILLCRTCHGTKPRRRRGQKDADKANYAAVHLPEKWLAVAQKLAERAQKPKLWHIIALLKKDAEEAGFTELPNPPWVKIEEGPKE